jgi:DNA-binding transcriptional LysR family regulator
MGLAYLPDYAVSGSIAAGRLVATLDAHVRHAGVMRALWPPSRYPAPKVRAFVDDLAKNLLPQRE